MDGSPVPAPNAVIKKSGLPYYFYSASVRAFSSGPELLMNTV